MSFDPEGIGHTFDQVRCEVTEDLVTSYKRSTGFPTSSTEPIPSTLASVYTYGIIAQLSSTKGAVLVGQKFALHRSPKVGETLLTEASVTARYEKRGQQYMEITTRTTAPDGSPVCDGTIIRILPPQE